jgi:microcystin-dependent protein
MGSPYVGEIRMFAGTFAPAGWAFCAGQLMAISENDTLFNLIGTTYGGDGQQTFGLPDLQGRVPVHQGTLPGGGTYSLGEKAGVEQVTLNTNQMPVHTHPPACAAVAGGTAPGNSVWAGTNDQKSYAASATGGVQMNTVTLPPAGGSQPHENMVPFLGISFIISLFGVFPSQT